MTENSKKHIVIGLGEVLWDVLPDGKQMGGSPLNVVYHCAIAGLDSIVVSAIGTDPLGDEIHDTITNLGLSTKYLQRNRLPTGMVNVVLNQGIPVFTIQKDVAWDQVTWNTELSQLAINADAAAYGSLGQRSSTSRQTIIKFLQSMRPDALKVFDVNLRQDFFSEAILRDSLNLSSVLKINDQELPVLGRIFNFAGSTSTQIKSLMSLFNIDFVAYTMGAGGSELYSPKGQTYLRAEKVNVKDTVGAGDAFTALLIAGLLNQHTMSEIHHKASKVASWVCENPGAMPPYP